MTEATQTNDTQAAGAVSALQMLLVSLIENLQKLANLRTAVFHRLVFELKDMGRANSDHFNALLAHLHEMDSVNESVEAIFAKMAEHGAEFMPPDMADAFKKATAQADRVVAFSDTPAPGKPAPGWPHLPSGALTRALLEADEEHPNAQPTAIAAKVYAPDGRPGLLAKVDDDSGQVKIAFADGSSGWFDDYRLRDGETESPASASASGEGSDSAA